MRPPRSLLVGLAWAALSLACAPSPARDAGTPPPTNGNVRIVGFTATPDDVAAGGTSQLSWESENAASCVITPPGDTVPRVGSVVVTMTTTTTYTLRCEGSGGPVEETATVTVAGSVPDAGPSTLDAGETADSGPAVDGGGNAGDAGVIDDDGGPLDDGGSDAGPGPVDAGPRPVRPIHRWSFTSQAGTISAVVPDLIGNADGAISGAVPDMSGQRLVFDGNDDYVDLPNGLVSGLSAITVEAWLVWNGTATAARWQRVWDFGTTNIGELTGPKLTGQTYSAATTTHFHFSPQTSADVMRMTVWPGSEGQETELEGPAPLPVGTLVHVAVTYDPAADSARIFQDGVAIAARVPPAPAEAPMLPLSDIDDVNCFFGRSNYSVDKSLDGELDEVRIYDRALTDEEIALSYALGPDGL